MNNARPTMPRVEMPRVMPRQPTQHIGPASKREPDVRIRRVSTCPCCVGRIGLPPRIRR